MKIIIRKCPRCERNISYKNEARALYAQEKGTLCKSCNTRNVQATWSVEKRALASKRREETKASLPDDVRQMTREKQRQSNVKTWKTLPETYVKATIENPVWREKLRSTKKYADPDARIRKIVETKTGVPYDQWLIIQSKCKLYSMQVRHHTSQQPLEMLPNYEARGFWTYHLDHMYSIAQGFRDGVAPEVIGHIVNLRYITMKENLAKNDDCSLTLIELLDAYANFLKCALIEHNY
jgi:hypothetical protein